MSERKINLEEAIKAFELENICKFMCADTTHYGQFPFYVEPHPIIKKLCLNFGKQLLELAAENADVKPYYNKNGLEVGEEVDKQSIIDTINQVI